MYDHCAHCNKALGTNTALPGFNIGTKVAYDAERKHAWVICSRCGSWNLCPLEQRPAVVDACEAVMQWPGADRIGPHQVRRQADGTEVIRLGRNTTAQRSAFRDRSRWRRRLGRQKAALTIAGGSPIATTLVGLAAAFGLMSVEAAATGVAGVVMSAAVAFLAVQSPIHIRPLVVNGWKISLSRRVLRAITVVRDRATNAWAVRVPLSQGLLERLFRSDSAERSYATFTGEQARIVLGAALARLNASGASPEIMKGVARDAEEHSLDELLALAGVLGERNAAPLAPVEFNLAASPYRLALEMALQVEDERRVEAARAADLDARWREAEQIAAIADDLLLAESDALI